MHKKLKPKILALFVTLLSFTLITKISFANWHQNIIEQTEQQTVNPADTAIIDAQNELKKDNSKHNQIQLVKAEFNAGLDHYSNNRYEPALLHFNKSLKLAQQNNLTDWIALNLNRIGNVHQMKSQYNLALEAYQKAAEISAKKSDNQLYARTLVNMGSVHALTGYNTKAIKLMLEALQTFETIDDFNGIAWTSLSIARLFNMNGFTNKAMKYANQALKNYKTINDNIGITLATTELANIYYHDKLFPQALLNAKQVLKMNILAKNIHAQAANYLLLGIIYYNMDSLQTAMTNLKKAEKIKQTLNDSIDLGKLYLYLGKVNAAQGKYLKATKLLNNSMEIALKQQRANELDDIYLETFNIYKKIGNHKIALDYLQKYAKIKDSINASDITRLEMQYNFDKREQEQEFLTRQKEAVQKANLKRQHTFIFLISTALIITIAFALVILRFLKEKQRTNQLLVERNAEIEQQKQEIETQCEYANQQRDHIAAQQKLITDSINYASRIQRAILPQTDTLKLYLKDYFIVYLPKNIVSGDFYWIAPLNDNRLAVAAADCTGHGVPGAFMSILGITLLKELSTAHNETAGDILSRLRKMVIEALHQSGKLGDSHDGMDMSLIVFDKNKNQFQFAAAYQRLLVARPSDQTINIQNNKPNANCQFTIHELKGDKMPIGFHVGGIKPFTTHTERYTPNDTFYVFSDGYPDQFGGPKRTKYTLNKLKQSLLQIQSKNLDEQGKWLTDNFLAYQGNEHQTDDVLVWGFKL